MTSVYRIHGELEVSNPDELLDTARRLHYAGPGDMNTVLASFYGGILSVEPLDDGELGSIHDVRARKTDANAERYEITARVVVTDPETLHRRLQEECLGFADEDLRAIYRENLGAAIAESIFGFEDGTANMYGLKPIGGLVAELDTSPSASYVLSDLEEPDPLKAEIAEKVGAAGMRLIGISGLNRDHVQEVADIAESMGLELQSASGPIKRSLTAMFSLDETVMFDRDLRHTPIKHVGYTPEELMQKYGADLLRKSGHPDINLRMLTPQISTEVDKQIGAGEGAERGIALVGVRFENEARLVREIGGTILHVISPDGADEERAMHKVHVTELGIGFKVGDAKIDYTPGLAEGQGAEKIEQALESTASPEAKKALRAS